MRPTLIGTKMTIRKWSIFVCHFRNAESAKTTLIGTDLFQDGFLSGTSCAVSSCSSLEFDPDADPDARMSEHQ